ncbi:MAG: FMN-binding domain-containing protein [Treponema sp.]|nr:MAG: FMN-binding domain-containing protein [Treponema sp.]
MKIIRFCVLFFCVAVLGSCSGDSEKLKQGSYIGVGQGNSGPIKVEVVVDKRHKMVDISVLEYCDTPGIGGNVFDYLIKAVVKKKSTDVDTVAGATYTSNGFLDAVEDALKKAKYEKAK